jgi:hydrogenase expression/formation protein HypE
LDKVIYPRLGAARREIIVGPRFGVDNAVVRVGGGKVLVATTDPLSFIPGLRPSESAWLSVNLLASDQLPAVPPHSTVSSTSTYPRR